jgi:hypothetical protein
VERLRERNAEDSYHARVRVSGVGNREERKLLCCLFTARAAGFVAVSSPGDRDPAAVHVELRPRDWYNCEIPERAFCEYTIEVTAGAFLGKLKANDMLNALVKRGGGEGGAFDLGKLAGAARRALEMGGQQEWASALRKEIDLLMATAGSAMVGAFSYTRNAGRSLEAKGYVFYKFVPQGQPTQKTDAEMDLDDAEEEEGLEALSGT